MIYFFNKLDQSQMVAIITLPLFYYARVHDIKVWKAETRGYLQFLANFLIGVTTLEQGLQTRCTPCTAR